MLLQMLLALLLSGSGVTAQKGNGKACEYVKDIKPIADPLLQFEPGKATFPCDFGAPVPLSKVPNGCAKFEILVGRGTSEVGELGMIVGDPLVARVKKTMSGENVRGYPVQYTGTEAGTSKGVADVQRRLEQQIKDCPDEKFALVGYSQGGVVMLYAARKLSAPVQEKVLAVVLYGAGNASTIADPFKPKLLVNCAPGDSVCPKSGSGAGHVSYNNIGTKWHDRSAEYIVSAFHGKPLGPKFMRSPIDTL